MQAGGEGRLAGTTSGTEADEKFIGMLEQEFAVKVEQATTKGGGWFGQRVPVARTAPGIQGRQSGLRVPVAWTAPGAAS